MLLQNHENHVLLTHKRAWKSFSFLRSLQFYIDAIASLGGYQTSSLPSYVVRGWLRLNVNAVVSDCVKF